MIDKFFIQTKDNPTTIILLYTKLTFMYTILVLLTICSISCEETSKSSQFAEVVNVRSTLNVREKPNTESIIVYKLYNGEKVEVCSDIQNEWVKIRKGDINGYVKASFLNYMHMEKKTLVTKADNKDANWESTVQDSGVWRVIKTIGYIILGIIGLVLFGLIFKYILFIIGLILSIIFTSLGGALMGGLIGFVLMGFNFDAAPVWSNYGLVIGFILGIIMAIVKPKEFVLTMFLPSSSQGSSGGSSGGTSGSGGSSSFDNSMRREPISIQRSANGEAYYFDDNGKQHWLHDTEMGFQEIGNGNLFDKNGYRT